MEFMSTEWPAPAKLNLFLHVVGRRADGFHLLQTVFQFIEYGDTLAFSSHDRGLIERVNDLPGVAPDSDLTVRAAKLLRAASGVNHGVAITIRKRLPMGGGLGGGSSDAATTLVALNHLWDLNWPVSRLAALGLQLGADVPVFLHGVAAWGEGVGEQLTPIELPEPWYVVVTPPCQVPTKEIFSDSDLTRDCSPIRIRNFLSGDGVNVCEPVVRKRYPLVAAALDWLAQYAPARMSGTGASVFAAFESEHGARAVLAQLPVDWRGFIARGCNRSPLLARAAATASSTMK